MEERGGSATLAEIIGDDACLDAMCAAEFSCNFIQLGFVAGDQNDGMATRGEFTGKLKADTGGRAGNQRAPFSLGCRCHVFASSSENEAAARAFPAHGSRASDQARSPRMR